MVVHVLKQTASRFEVNFHVRGTDFIMKQPSLVQQRYEELLPDWHWDNYIMGFTKPIEQYLFSDLLIKIQVFMYQHAMKAPDEMRELHKQFYAYMKRMKKCGCKTKKAQWLEKKYEKWRI